MPLATGTRLGPYEVLGPAGAGGMGEVYRARDTRLERTVAVKVLPESVATDPEFRQRFEREGRAISSLQHPHICTLYDIGRQDGIEYLVMEFVEGESLADRLMKGPLPPREVIRLGTELADALDKAHRQGITHRDLKPGNIMLTRSGVKLLDFGLAKPAPVQTAVNTVLTAMTTSKPLTAEGKIVGTFQYMAPEQVEGREADARSDIFALGAVLYEAATGKKAFDGRTQASVIAAVLAGDPPAMAAIQPLTPPALERIVRTCLAKDPEERWQSAADVARQLKWLEESSVSATAKPPGRRRWPQWLWIAAAAASGILLGVLVLRPAGDAGDAIYASIVAPANSGFVFTSDVGGPPALSPDARSLVYAAQSQNGTRMLWLQRLSAGGPQPLSGTENATFPFWSPDSRSIAFFANGKLNRVEIGGGMPTAICRAADGRGGTWNREGVIVFAPEFRSGLFRVGASGGEPQELTRVDASKHTSHRWPEFLPDGRHFLYLAVHHDPNQAENNGLYWASLDGKENRLVMRSSAAAAYAAGKLLYLREEMLLAQDFDPGSGQLNGGAVTLATGVAYDRAIWRGAFTASGARLLAYQAGGHTSGNTPQWVDREGKKLGMVGEPDFYRDYRISRDGRRLALARGDPSDIWIFDIERGTGARFTFDAGNNEFMPVWSPDGRQLAFSSDRGGKSAVYIRDLRAGGGEQLVQQHEEPLRVNDWSPDGKFILYEQGEPGRRIELWAIPLNGERKPFPVVQTNGAARVGQFSPDGRWIAYQSNESGRFEIYVTRFTPGNPAGGGKWQVSGAVGGSRSPVWRRDGKELYFINAGSRLVAATVNGRGEGFEVGETRTVLRSTFAGGYLGFDYDVMPDGKKFILFAGNESSGAPLSLVVNWTAELKK